MSTMAKPQLTIMEDVLRGRVHKYGDNIDTDVIIPGQYLKEMDPNKLALHAMEGIDSEFVKRVKKGDLIAAGRNFGCGSSREHAPLALRYSGIRAVLAQSFARIFFRNAIDGGHLLPVEIDRTTYEKIRNGDQLEVDLNKGEIRNLTRNEIYKIKPLSKFVREVVAAGGIFRVDPAHLSQLA